jgi:hypothetical protein
MNHNSCFPVEAVQQDPGQSDVRKGMLDLILLRYMARRLHLTLRQLEQPANPRNSQTWPYRMQERHGRTHRIAIYQPQELLVKLPLSFVGFVSRKRRQLSLSIIKAIEKVDKVLIEELAEAPGILSYSSLELQNGHWCNLVLLRDDTAKMHLKSSSTHKYAAYDLAHSYYEWIRLHNGVMPEGLDHMEMLLQKTKYYIFHPSQQRLLCEN